jgi:Flp pilus assembly protein CpaB
MTYRLRNIGIAVALAAVAGLLTIFYVSNYKRSVVDAESDVTVWVAARDIPAGATGADLVEDGLLKEQDVAKKSVAPGAISTTDQIEDKVTASTIYAGEQITTRRFTTEAEKGVRAQITGNMRAMHVPGDSHQLMLGTLKAGDHVDVVASIKYKFVNFRQTAGSKNNEEMTASRVVLRDLLVLAGPTKADQNSKLTDPNAPLAVKLAVTDTQSQKLFFVMKNADWSLQLRPTTDAADSAESVETVGSVLGDGLGPAQLRELVLGRRTQ